jgi:hypothetical protein
MFMAGEVVTAPLAMAAALGSAFLMAWMLGAYVVWQVLRRDARMNEDQASFAEPAEPTEQRAA